MSDPIDDPKIAHIKTLKELEQELREADPTWTPEKEIGENVHHLHEMLSLETVKLLNFDDLKNLPIKPVDWVLEPYLPTEGICWIYAESGAGKTYFCLQLAYAIATGGGFLKYNAPRPRKVLYVDAEMSQSTTQNRILNIGALMGEPDFPENLVLMNNCHQLPFQCPQIDDPRGQQFYTRLMQHHDFDVLFLDNLSMLSSFDENKAHEWAPIQRWLLYLRSLGKTIFIVHHSGKSKDYRGTSKMMDSANMAVQLEIINSDSDENNMFDGKKIKLSYKKARDFWGKYAMPYEITFHGQRWEYRSIEDSELEKVADLRNLKMSQRDIGRELGMSLGKVNRLVKKALTLKMIREE